MSALSHTTSGTSWTLEEKLLLAVITYFLLLRFVFIFCAFPVADESYYWLWGRHPALSYFDHPPLQGWLQGLSYAVFGRSLFALRWLTLLAFAGNLWIFNLVAQRLAGAAWRPWLLRSTAVYLAAPLFGFFGTLAFHDYLLVFFVLASGYCFIRYFADVEEHGAGLTRDLMAGAALLGLAALTKYNGAFLGLAVAGTVLMRPKLRPLLLRWELYAAAALAIAMQSPVIIWNLQNELGSFGYQLGSRHGASGTPMLFNLGGAKGFVGEQLLMVSPFLMPMIVMFFWARQRQVFERVGKTIAIWTFWISSLVCLYVATFSWVIWWWNIVAFALIFPFAGRYARGWLLALHIGWGVAVGTFLAVSYTIVPVTVLFGGGAGMETERSFGFDELVAAVEAARAERGAQFIAANHYITASQLAFALDDPDVAELSERQTAFDDWFDPASRTGQSAIVVIEPSTDTAYWQRYFESFSEIGEVKATRFGYAINSYTLYLGTGFAPLDAPENGP